MYLIIQNRKKKSFFKEWMTLKKALSISYTNAFILALHIKNDHGIVLEKPKRQRISRNTEDNSKYYSNWDMIVNHSIKKWNKMR